jgi:hypothetical protein
MRHLSKYRALFLLPLLAVIFLVGWLIYNIGLKKDNNSKTYLKIKKAVNFRFEPIMLEG